MRLDQATLADLAVAFTPVAYLRVMPLRHRSTPLGMGYGATRFSSPNDAFKVIYIAEDLCTGLAETLIRDRFQARLRRRISITEASAWGAAEIFAMTALRLVDLRTTGLLRLGVSSDAARAKSHRSGRVLSAAIHDKTDADGVVYRSRLTNGICCAVYERAAWKLDASPVEDLVTVKAFVPALRSLNVEVVR